MKLRLHTLVFVSACCLLSAAVQSANAAQSTWYVHRTDYTNWVNGVAQTCRCYSVSPSAPLVGGTVHTWVEAQGPYDYAVKERDRLTASDPLVCTTCRYGRSQKHPPGGDASGPSLAGRTIYLMSPFTQVKFIDNSTGKWIDLNRAEHVGGGAVRITHSGKVIGEFRNGVFRGIWVQEKPQSGPHQCASSRHSSFFWGNIVLNISAKRAEGHWDYCGTGRQHTTRARDY